MGYFASVLVMIGMFVYWNKFIRADSQWNDNHRINSMRSLCCRPSGEIPMKCCYKQVYEETSNSSGEKTLEWSASCPETTINVTAGQMAPTTTDGKGASHCNMLTTRATEWGEARFSGETRFAERFAGEARFAPNSLKTNGSKKKD